MDVFKDLFCKSPGITVGDEHDNPTTRNPVKVPPHRVPAHYRDEVECQIEMLDLDIIEESSRPWMAPAVFMEKKSGEICLYMDYQELNRKTTKDVYPLSLPDEVHNRLVGSTVFSTLEFQRGLANANSHQ